MDESQTINTEAEDSHEDWLGSSEHGYFDENGDHVVTKPFQSDMESAEYSSEELDPKVPLKKTKYTITKEIEEN